MLTRILGLLVALLSDRTWAQGSCGQCGKDIQTFGGSIDSGVIKSPGYPDKEYCNNLLCSWVIKEGTSGQGIKITFDAFSTENNADKLELEYIVDGVNRNLTAWEGTVDGTSIGTLSFPEAVGLEFRFTTDVSIAHEGFQIRFQRFEITDSDCVCGPLVNHAARASKRRVKSPNYPESYCHNLRCFYALIADPNESVSIRFDEFQTEDRFDHLRIYDGLTVDENKVLADLNGTLTPKAANERTFSSMSEGMLLEFRSDGDKAHKGWSARFKADEGKCTCANETLTESSGTLKSPGFDEGFYCPDMRCNYSIRVRSGRRIQLDFSANIVGYRDRVSVVNANGEAYNFINLQGRSRAVFTSDTGAVDVQFLSYQSDTRRPPTPGQKFGFNATYITLPIDDDCKCPSHHNPLNLTEDHGVISGEACGPLDCFYRNESILFLYPKEMDITGESASLRVYKESPPGSFSQNVVRHFTSETVRFHDYVKNVTIDDASSNPVAVHFQATNRSDSNFELYYEWMDQSCECEGIEELNVTEEHLVLTSPGYPSPYCNNMFCSWRLSADYGQKIVISVDTFSTEVPDPLTFFEGPHESANKEITSMNGTVTSQHGSLPRVVESDRHEMLIRFRTDGSVIYKGWSLTYHAEEADTPEPTTPATGGGGGSGGGGGGGGGGHVEIRYVTPQWYNADPLAGARKQAQLTRDALSQLSKTLGQSREIHLSGVPMGWALGAGLGAGLLLGLLAAVLFARLGCSLPNIRRKGASLPSVGLHLKRENGTPDFVVNESYEAGPSSESAAL